MPKTRTQANARAKYVRLVLHDLQSPINIGMILRIAENFRADVHVFDPRSILRDPDKVRTISDFACGALERRPPKLLASASAFKRLRRTGRLVATAIDGQSVELPDFRWRPGDIVVLGNEYDGLPEALVSTVDARLHIPQPPGFAPKPRSYSPIDPDRAMGVMRDGMPNMNVAVATGILCFEAYLNLARSRPSKKRGRTDEGRKPTRAKSGRGRAA